MTLRDLLQRNRSCRRFSSEVVPSSEQIKDWIESLRYTASARNLQPLKYQIVVDDVLCRALTDSVGWAGYLTDWPGPSEDERPRAWVVQLLDERLAPAARFDEGLHLEALTLQVVEAGFGACIMTAFDPKKLGALLELPHYLRPISVVAIGLPAEQIQIEALSSQEGGIRYYRDELQVHHVPKRTLEEILYGVR